MLNPASLFHRLFFVILGLAFVTGPLNAATEVALLDVRPDGRFEFDRIEGFVGHFDPQWKRVVQTRPTGPAAAEASDRAGRDFRVQLRPAGADTPIALHQRVERLAPDSFRLAYEAKHPTGVPTRELYLQLTIPLEVGAGRTLLVDDRPHVLPMEFAAARVLSLGEASRRLVLPAATGTVTVEGVFSLLVQDQREWRSDSYSVRLRFAPSGDILHSAGLEATLRHTPYRSAPVSIREAVNFGFSDEVADDRRGGWTDQGPDNDLRSLPAGPLHTSGIAFDILDETANRGRGAIVLAGPDRAYLPRNATVRLPAEARDARHLYLLHASGWTPPSDRPVGAVIVRHADGGAETRHEILSGRDVGNWWSPAVLPRAAVGWTGETPRSEVGLYVTRVPLGNRPVRELVFESSGEGVWMIAALSVSPDDIPLFTEVKPWTAAAGRDWVEHRHEIEIEAGSVFDFSAGLHAPAGKYGPIMITPEGRFAFRDRPDERVRFWGVNLCFSANYPEKELADRLAERLARSGYNTIRIHHYDRRLQKAGGDSWELDPEMLDRLDYLFAAMKRRGLYINLDLYTSRAFSEAEFTALGFEPGSVRSDMHWRFKALMPVSELAFETWSRFARNLLTHRNPYTGLTWAEDPALVGVCPVNEDSPSARVDNDPVVRRAYRAAFEKWLAEPANRAAAAGDREHAFNRFVYEAHIRHDARMREFLHGLGLAVPLTGTNYRTVQGLTLVREHYDYVDMHQYWDHPGFPRERFRLPFQFRQTSATRFAAQTPRSLMPTRIPGKPFSVSEFNYVRPNRHRAEGGVIMPAYASLQDWDALYNFEYSQSRDRLDSPGVDGTFSIVSDPIGMIADRVAAALFLRGDIAPARGEIGFAVQTDTVFTSRDRHFPDAFSRLGLVTRIGSRATDPASLLAGHGLGAVVVDAEAHRSDMGRRVYPADSSLARTLQRDGVIPAGSVSDDDRRFVSDTRQIELRSDEGSMRVVTPRSELFVLPPQAVLAGESVAVRNGGTFGAVAVVAVDGEPLASSARLLVTHLTDALPTGMAFANTERTLLEKVGEMPFLVRRGSVEITLRLGRGDYRAWAVSPTGARLAEVPLTRTPHGWRLLAETVTDEGTRFAYEIARRE